MMIQNYTKNVKFYTTQLHYNICAENRATHIMWITPQTNIRIFSKETQEKCK